MPPITPLLDQVQTPADFRTFSLTQLKQLADEVRAAAYAACAAAPLALALTVLTSCDHCHIYMHRKGRRPACRQCPDNPRRAEGRPIDPAALLAAMRRDRCRSAS